MNQNVTDQFELTRRAVIHNGQAVMCQGVTARSLIRMAKEADPEAVVMFAVMLPTGKTMWAGVQGLITDFDQTGACCVLLDMNVANAIAKGTL